MSKELVKRYRGPKNRFNLCEKRAFALARALDQEMAESTVLEHVLRNGTDVLGRMLRVMGAVAEHEEWAKPLRAELDSIAGQLTGGTSNRASQVGRMLIADDSERLDKWGRKVPPSYLRCRHLLSYGQCRCLASPKSRLGYCLTHDPDAQRTRMAEKQKHRCKATRKDGAPCSAHRQQGREFCKDHG